MSAYDPYLTPFSIPLAVIGLRLVLERPTAILAQDGRLALLLRGALRSALLREGCLLGPASPCGGSSAWTTQACLHPASCVLPPLYAPRSESQGRDYPSPILLWAEAGGDARAIDAQLVLWGRRATAHESLVQKALVAAGQGGLWCGKVAATFRTDEVSAFRGALGEWVSQVTPRDGVPRVLAVELAAPCEPGRGGFPEILGRLAHDSVQWDLEERGDADRLGKSGCDALAEEARAAAERSVARLRIDGEVWAEHRGQHTSRANGGRFALRGIRGWLRLRGDLGPAWPWLLALNLRGAGGRKSYGLGRVRLWYPAAVGATDNGPPVVRS